MILFVLHEILNVFLKTNIWFIFVSTYGLYCIGIISKKYPGIGANNLNWNTHNKTDQQKKKKRKQLLEVKGLIKPSFHDEILPEGWRFFFEQPVGLDLYCPKRGLVRSHPIFAFLFIFLNYVLIWVYLKVCKNWCKIEILPKLFNPRS